MTQPDAPTVPIAGAYCEVKGVMRFNVILEAGEASVASVPIPDSTDVRLTLQSTNGNTITLELSPADAAAVGRLLVANWVLG